MTWFSNMRMCFALLLTVGLAASCAPAHLQPDAAAPFLKQEATDVFSAGYGSIADKHIDEVTPAALALEGMRGLASIDPGLAVSRQGDTIVLASSEMTTQRYPAPADSDVQGWAALTADVSTAGRQASRELRASSTEKIYEAVFDGALSNLDVFSRYAGAEEAKKNRARREGFGGIGVRFKVRNNIVRVTSVMPGTPAQRAAIRPGDRISHIGDVPVAGLVTKDIVELLRGRLYSVVRLTVLRDGVAAPLEFEIKRAHIIPPTVTYGFKDGIVYLKVSGFNQNTAKSLGSMMEKARRAHADEIRGWVLDMRGNPGGLLKQSIKAADLFLTSGDIINTRGRHPHSFQHYEASGRDLADGQPVAVLIDGKSASAAEVLAAALQDHGRAVVIGTASYGKGTVQTVIRLPNDGEITLTWSRLIAPSGYALHGLGVLPAICTSGVIGDNDELFALDPAERSRNAATVDAWRKAPLNDKSRRDFLRLSCPAQRRKQALEVKVARRLIATPMFYARALGLSALTAEAFDEDNGDPGP